MADETKEKEVTVFTARCPQCFRTGQLQLTEDQYERYMQKGKPIQMRLPELSADIREQLITGYHPHCWEVVMNQHGWEEE